MFCILFSLKINNLLVVIYVVNLNYIFLEYETAVDHGVCGAEGCVMSFVEDRAPAAAFCDSSFK